jgi:hypothetical protein
MSGGDFVAAAGLDCADEGIGVWREAIIASEVEPFGVNESETGVLLGNINYAPYTACK